ncbi:hypothetical protein BofuT4_uP066140.1 [Botrytis cinerea T4]|uniref:Uncharacterized protein n=1 Tax=Botryotinia fuckeliana (strain T4) TaxID=999810 RepID=G2XRT9_BOTF4|nr:hypothetical protein BofuT4_uP066140.1 [Botrytis cinerea T4]
MKKPANSGSHRIKYGLEQTLNSTTQTWYKESRVGVHRNSQFLLQADVDNTSE